MSGFSLGKTVNNTASWFCNAPIIRNVISNPIYTSLLITALASIVVMALYHYNINQICNKRGIRVLIYVFFITTAVLFVHHYSVLHQMQEINYHKGVTDVFSNIQQSRVLGGSSSIPVYPMGYENVNKHNLNERNYMPDVKRDNPDEKNYRPDNVSSQNMPLIIEDVILPVYGKV